MRTALLSYRRLQRVICCFACHVLKHLQSHLECWELQCSWERVLVVPKEAHWASWLTTCSRCLTSSPVSETSGLTSSQQDKDAVLTDRQNLVAEASRILLSCNASSNVSDCTRRKVSTSYCYCHQLLRTLTVFWKINANVPILMYVFSFIFLEV